MRHAKKGDWVQIQKIILPAGERAPQVPDDTQRCNLMLWVKGFAENPAGEGEEVQITTITGRKERGLLCEVNPRYGHDFGEFQPELLQVALQARELLAGEGD